jgi:hypothetical protein
MDNGSKDKSWEFICDTNDPRIKVKQEFKHNIGCAHALNFGISHRELDQDWINVEYDYIIHDKKFITSFQEVYKEFPELGGISATITPSQRELIDNEIKKTPSRYHDRNGKRIYTDSIMGFCSYIPFETMNELMYYNEIDCFADVELNLRIQGLKKSSGYALDINCSHMTFGGFCDTCGAFGAYCEGLNEHGESRCTKYYHRIITQVTEAINMMPKYAKLRKDIEENGIYPPLKCDSIFNDDNTMSKEDKEKSEQVIELFYKFSRKFENKTDGENNA